MNCKQHFQEWKKLCRNGCIFYIFDKKWWNNVLDFNVWLDCKLIFNLCLYAYTWLGYFLSPISYLLLLLYESLKWYINLVD